MKTSDGESLFELLVPEASTTYRGTSVLKPFRGNQYYVIDCFSETAYKESIYHFYLESLTIDLIMLILYYITKLLYT